MIKKEIEMTSEENESDDAFSFLGIDWGTKKIGIAIADSETRVPLALRTLTNDADFWNALETIIETHRVREIIVGIPSHVNRGMVRYPSEIFATELSRRFDIPIRLENEMFTTRMARADLIERGAKGRLDDLDDAEAARIILESWLARIGRL